MKGKLLTVDEVKQLIPNGSKYWLQATKEGIANQSTEEDTGIAILIKINTPFGEKDFFVTKKGNEIRKESATISWKHIEVYEWNEI